MTACVLRLVYPHIGTVQHITIFARAPLTRDQTVCSGWPYQSTPRFLNLTSTPSREWNLNLFHHHTKMRRGWPLWWVPLLAMLGKVRSDWFSPGLVTLQEVCTLFSAITSDYWAAHGLNLECPSLRMVASTSYRVQSIRPVAPDWEYTWLLGHVDLLRPGRWLRLAAHPPSGAVWTSPPHEV